MVKTALETKELGTSRTTAMQSIKEMGGKNLVRVENPLLVLKMKLTHLQCCQALDNDLKSPAHTSNAARNCLDVHFNFW